MFLPEEDKFTYRQKELVDQLCVAMGGRVAEEITFGNVTNGAVGDIRMATNIARKMVCEWGMSEELGMIEYGEARGEVFVARDTGSSKGYSEQTSLKIDLEIKKLIDDAYQRATDLLTEHGETLKILSEALLDFETLDANQVNDIIKYGEMKNPPSTPAAKVDSAVEEAKSEAPAEELTDLDGDKPAEEKQEPAGAPA